MKPLSLAVPGILVALVLLSLAATAVYSPAARNVDRGFSENTLYASAELMLVADDPANAAMKGEVDLLRHLYEGLVRQDPETLEIRPGAAESWQISDDNLIYEFKLRAGLSWCDGTPFGPEAFISAARRALEPGSKVLRTRPFLHLKQAPEYKTGKITNFEEVGISSPRPGYLRLELRTPVPGFLHDLAGPGAWPDHQRNTGRLLVNSVGNGPFMVESAACEKIVLRRNPHYWEQGVPALERVVLLPSSPESASAPLRFDAGELHIASGIAGWVAERLENRGELVVGRVWSVFYVIFDTDQAPFDDPELRLALSLAVDREGLAHMRRDPAGSIGWSVVPPLVPGYPQNLLLRDRRAEAKSLLASYVSRSGKPLAPLTVHFGGGDEIRQAALEVARSWREVLGIAADVMSASSRSGTSKAPPRIQLAGLAGSKLDPLNLLGGFDGGSAIGGTKWSNQDFSKRIKAAYIEQDTRTRNLLLQEAEEILLREAPVIPLFYGQSIHLVHPRVKGWHTNSLDLRSFRDVRLE